MPSWKKILLRSAGFGAGFALTLCIVVGVWAWYNARPKPPKPWNTKTIQAEYLGTSDEENTSGVGFRYALKNNGKEDYRISDSDSVQLSINVGNDSELLPFVRLVSIDTPIFVPAGHKTVVFLKMKTGTKFQQQLPEHPTDDEKERYRKAVLDFLNSTQIVGFALFDEVRRIEIDFPNGWKKPQSQK
jgi:hypothetical protein